MPILLIILAVGNGWRVVAQMRPLIFGYLIRCFNLKNSIKKADILKSGCLNWLNYQANIFISLGKLILKY
ncbi:UNVERIFIED_CONTAM: hypothetical protein GTU68_003640 [Idotea baltica]|nr:hypothetical protein [Idotea baltica]